MSGIQTSSYNWPVRSLATTVILLTLFVSGCVSSSKYEIALEQNEALQEELASLTNQLKLQQNKVNALEKQKKQLESELSSTTEKLQLTNQELDAKNQELADAQQQLADINNQLIAKNQELNATSQELMDKQQALADTTQKLQATADYVSKTNKLYDDLVSQLSTELEANQIKIQEMKDGVNVNLSENILFSSGSAKLNASGQDVIIKVSEKLKDIPHQIIVAGFTDNIPIRGSLTNFYPTNWELAGARAASVVRLLEKQGVVSSKLTAVSYGENKAVTSNDTADGRSQNRRIEIHLRPAE
ncbi:MAG: OmpA family protein [Gammaproteobacteria bacterium]|nr:OmpA family protein [Gammaproteobacteria bacterium]